MIRRIALASTLLAAACSSAPVIDSSAVDPDTVDGDATHVSLKLRGRIRRHAVKHTSRHKVHRTTGTHHESADHRAEWLFAHNKFRCMHGQADLQWDVEVAWSAQEYAETMTGMYQSNSYQLPPPAGPAAESLIAQPSEKPVNILKMVTSWYDEVNSCASFPGCPPRGDSVVRHFTAMVWAGTTKVGCGYAEDDVTGFRYYVCRYKAGDTITCDTPNVETCFATHVQASVKSESECALRR